VGSSYKAGVAVAYKILAYHNQMNEDNKKAESEMILYKVPFVGTKNL
jgi:hypothetical protein